jgi:hypothetical protein
VKCEGKNGGKNGVKREGKDEAMMNVGLCVDVVI